MAIAATLLLVNCSKSTDPASSAANCTFTFKGTTYSMAGPVCITLGTDQELNAGNGTSGQVLGLNKSGSSNEINFSTNASDLNALYDSNLAGINPTITVSGKVWTFSGTLENSNGDSGTISGTCTCQ